MTRYTIAWHLEAAIGFVLVVAIVAILAVVVW